MNRLVLNLYTSIVLAPDAQSVGELMAYRYRGTWHIDSFVYRHPSDINMQDYADKL